MATHLNKEGYDETLVNIKAPIKGKDKPKVKELSKKQIGDEWKRLQGFMVGRK